MTMQYWTIRWVPDVVRGEFVNIGVLAGDDETRDWAIQHVDSFRRANLLGGDAGRAQSYLEALSRRVSSSLLPPGIFGDAPELSSVEIERIRAHQSNSVQLSEPRLVHASSALEALGIIYPLMVDEPEVHRRSRARTRLVNALGTKLERVLSSREVDLERNLVGRAAMERGKFDFVAASGHHAQLAHAWSFRTQDASITAEKTGAWAWFVSEFRRQGVHLASKDGRSFDLDSDTPLVVIHDAPSSDGQAEVLRAARSSWRQLGATVHESDELDEATREVLKNLALAS